MNAGHWCPPRTTDLRTMNRRQTSENARWRRESKNPGLGEAKRCHPVFLFLQIIHFFRRILKSNLNSGLCYAGNILQQFQDG
jgi:hypothetical protein